MWRMRSGAPGWQALATKLLPAGAPPSAPESALGLHVTLTACRLRPPVCRRRFCRQTAMPFQEGQARQHYRAMRVAAERVGGPAAG